MARMTEKELAAMLQGRGLRVIDKGNPAPGSVKKPVPRRDNPSPCSHEVFKGGLITIFIAGDVRSSKNSQRIAKRQDGSPLVMQSKAATAYVKESRSQWRDNADSFKRAAENLPKPLSVVFQWVRKTKGQFDHTGPLEMALDCMTGKKFKDPSMAWIADDTAADICPIPHPIVLHDKHNAGVYITLLAKHPLE